MDLIENTLCFATSC